MVDHSLNISVKEVPGSLPSQVKPRILNELLQLPCQMKYLVDP